MVRQWQVPRNNFLRKDDDLARYSARVFDRPMRSSAHINIERPIELNDGTADLGIFWCPGRVILNSERERASNRLGFGWNVHCWNATEEGSSYSEGETAAFMKACIVAFQLAATPLATQMGISDLVSLTITPHNARSK
jgi:hypothetical protein